MKIISALSKGWQAIVDEYSTPESFKIGEQFENYVRNELFVDRYYDIMERTHSYKANQDYIHSSMKPDFTFWDKWTKKEFYVEVKFRTGLYGNKIVWCNENQLIRYLQYSKQRPMFLALGMGDSSKKPDAVYLIPMQEARYTGLFPSHAQKFAIKANEPISSKVLWGR